MPLSYPPQILLRNKAYSGEEFFESMQKQIYLLQRIHRAKDKSQSKE